MCSLSQIQESENQLHLAIETYQRVKQMAGDPPMPVACKAYLGPARVLYEWNDLDSAHQYGQQIKSIDTPADCMMLLARLNLARGEIKGTAALLDKAEKFVRQHDFCLPDIAAVKVMQLLQQGDPAAATGWAEKYDLPASQARVHLAKGDGIMG